jgi:hypothetical protein
MNPLAGLTRPLVEASFGLIEKQRFWMERHC